MPPLTRTATLLCLAASLACSSADGPTPPSDNSGWIYYGLATVQFGYPALYRIHPDGSGRQLLASTNNRANDQADASPDGNTLAFASQRDFMSFAGENPTLRLIYLANPDGTNQRRLTTNSPLHCSEQFPRFSHDGRKLAFYMPCDNRFPEDAEIIYSINVDGTGLTQLNPSHADLDVKGPKVWPAWSADDSKIVFTAELKTAQATFEVFSMNADGSGARRLTFLETEGRTAIHRPMVVGDTIYYMSIRTDFIEDGAYESIRLDGTHHQILYNIPAITSPPNLAGVAQDRQFATSPDGKSVVLQRFSSSNQHDLLVRTSLTGTSPFTIDGSGWVVWPIWK